MTNDSKLVAKLEAATEGSRDLDYAIAEALGREAVRDMQGTFAPWKYTTSIDAALTLVPEGLAYGLREQPPFQGRITFDACIYRRVKVGDGWTHRKVSASNPVETAPLAICIAALKARGIQ